MKSEEVKVSKVAKSTYDKSQLVNKYDPGGNGGGVILVQKDKYQSYGAS